MQHNVRAQRSSGAMEVDSTTEIKMEFTKGVSSTMEMALDTTTMTMTTKTASSFESKTKTKAGAAAAPLTTPVTPVALAKSVESRLMFARRGVRSWDVVSRGASVDSSVVAVFHPRADVEAQRPQDVEALHEQGFSLGKPVIRGDMCIVGTDEPNGIEREKHYLTCFNWRLPNRPVKIYDVSSSVRDLQWFRPNRLAMATNDGGVQLFDVNLQHDMEFKRHVPHLHTSAITEMAFDTYKPQHFVSGSVDSSLTHFDVEASKIIQSTPDLPGAITSVEWPVCNQSKRIRVACSAHPAATADVCVSLTTINGWLKVFNLTQPLSNGPAFDLFVGNDKLFGHCRYTEYHILCVSGSGHVYHYDMRHKKQPVTKVKLPTKPDRPQHQFRDPHVSGIGVVKHAADPLGDHRYGAFVLSGFDGFSVYRHDMLTGEARFWSHSISTPSIPKETATATADADPALSMYAVFVDHGQQVLASGSDGKVTVYKQDYATH